MGKWHRDRVTAGRRDEDAKGNDWAAQIHSQLFHEASAFGFLCDRNQMRTHGWYRDMVVWGSEWIRSRTESERHVCSNSRCFICSTFEMSRSQHNVPVCLCECVVYLGLPVAPEWAVVGCFVWAISKKITFRVAFCWVLLLLRHLICCVGILMPSSAIAEPPPRRRRWWWNTKHIAKRYNQKRNHCRIQSHNDQNELNRIAANG